MTSTISLAAAICSMVSDGITFFTRLPSEAMSKLRSAEQLPNYENDLVHFGRGLLPAASADRAGAGHQYSPWRHCRCSIAWRNLAFLDDVSSSGRKGSGAKWCFGHHL